MALSSWAHVLVGGFALALNNGLGETPALGWSTWYAAPDGSQVTSAFVRANAAALVSSGLAAKGYTYVNVDEGWLLGRHPNGSIYEDLDKFPEGMAALGAWVRAQEVSPGSSTTLRYGLYTCRGTCQCGTGKYSGPGSEGHEAADVAWMVHAGAQWLKVDSCCASQDHGTAFADYARFRDALNASGTPVWFNLCGWNGWYAPPDPALNYTGGASLGNSWRVSGDGASYAAITATVNTMAAIAPYTGPGGWNDADNLLGPHGDVGVVTEGQARAQMVLWSLFPTQLILGEDMTQASAEYVDTVGNVELLAINQDAPFAGPARRVVGGDLTYPCQGGALPVGALFSVQATPCSSADVGQLWAFNATGGTLALASGGGLLTVQGCGTADGTLVYVYPPTGDSGSACGGASSGWVLSPRNNSVVNPFSGKCLDEYEWTTARVDLWTCVPGATNEAWAFSGNVTGGTSGTLHNADSGLCLTATGVDPHACTNVWARRLSTGATAVGMVNNGADAALVTCDAACFAAANVTGSGGLRLRDLIAHADLGVLHPPYTFTANVTGDGGGAAFTLTPV